MTSYILRRLSETVFLLLALSFLIYGLIGLMPGDPIDMMLSANPDMTTADAQRLKGLYGLDQPLWHRYAHWLRQVVQGDFGYSRLYSQPTLDVLQPRIGNTLWLLGASFVLALLIAVPAGVAAARRPGGMLDGTINLVAFAGFSIPSFWLGLLLIIVFSVHLGWLPAGGIHGLDDTGLLDRLRYMVLPVLTLTALSAGTFLRFVRAAMIDALQEDHVRTARAKGCSERRGVWIHAMGNAMIPIVTVTTLQLGSLFSGALVVETMFSYHGMGKLIYDAILGNDFNLALAALMLAATMTLLANLLADLAYAWLDPRVDYGS